MKTRSNNQFWKICLTIVAGIGFFISSANAQRKYSSANAPFQKGSNVLGFFVGASDHYPAYAPAAVIFGATFDHGIINNAGPGNIGIGGVLGFRTSPSKHYDYGDNSFHSFIAAVRGSYHLTLLVDKNNKFDPYAGVTFGASFNDRKNKYAYETGYDNVSPIAGVFIGARYNFMTSVGVFAEAAGGSNLSYIAGGINFNF